MRSERGGGRDDTGQGMSLGFTLMMEVGAQCFHECILATMSRTGSESVWGVGRDLGGPCLFSPLVRGGRSSEGAVSGRKKRTHMGQRSWGDPFECTNVQHGQGKGLGGVWGAGPWAQEGKISGSLPSGALSTRRSRMRQTCNHSLFPGGIPRPGGWELEGWRINAPSPPARCLPSPSRPPSPLTALAGILRSPSLLLREPVLMARPCTCRSHPFSRPLCKFPCDPLGL